MRQDLAIIANWVKPSAHVLDLACGDGALLWHLETQKQVRGYGLEIDPEKITACISRGVDVIEQDLNRGLKNFADDSYDTVIMTQALQVLRRQDLALDEMLRVGREAIVTFPNFAHWRCRLFLAFRGRLPVSRTLPYQWYDTPNIHLITFKDFEALCADKNIRILDRAVGNLAYEDHWKARLWPNLFGEVAIYRISR
ncbi:methionine biosynthesis protein MetW [Marinospirillum sp.]|uniref:methionine biosynthesis protein MetW n=1 Tax=Marinospirillum sp. TaxID=2183934 RepID=UPI00286FE37D|nr:methionine biosynthesis protein MetW [Marinospirillum sp.]MDR9469187.1 methionine biosynthesis protein MetW [Marinospirillum sp.]